MFESHIPKANKQINACLAEIANQTSTETTVTNCHDPDICWFTNPNEPQQYQSTYTSQHHRSYSNSYNRKYNCTWESHTERTCNSCGTKGHIAKHCTKHAFWCHTATHDTAACRSKPRLSTAMESPSAGSYHPTQSLNQHNTSSQPPAPIHTTHNLPQLHQAMRNGPSC